MRNCVTVPQLFGVGCTFPSVWLAHERSWPVRCSSSGGEPTVTTNGSAHKSVTTAATRKAVCAAMKDAVHDVTRMPSHVQAPSKLDAAAASVALPDSLLNALSVWVAGQSPTATITSTAAVKLCEVAVWKRAFDNCDTNPLAAMVAMAVTMPGMYNVVRKLLNVASSSTARETGSVHQDATKMRATGHVAADTHKYSCDSPLACPARPSPAAGGSPAPVTTRPLMPTPAAADVRSGLNTLLESDGDDDSDEDGYDYEDEEDEDDVVFEDPDDIDDADGADDAGDAGDADDADTHTSDGVDNGGDSRVEAQYDHDELVEFARAGTGYPLADGEEPTPEEKREARELLQQMAMRPQRDAPLASGEEFGGSTVFMSKRGSRKHVVSGCGSQQKQQEFPAMSAQVINIPWCKACTELHAQGCVEIDTEVLNALHEAGDGEEPTVSSSREARAGVAPASSSAARASGSSSLAAASASASASASVPGLAASSPASAVQARYLSASAHARGSGSMHTSASCRYIANGKGVVRMAANDPRLRQYGTCSLCMSGGSAGAPVDTASVLPHASPRRAGAMPSTTIDPADADLAAALAASALHEAETARRREEAAVDCVLSTSALGGLQRALATGSTAQVTFTVHARENCCGVTTAYKGTLADLTAMFDTVRMNPVPCKTCERHV